jgi:hypothetical protein
MDDFRLKQGRDFYAVHRDASGLFALNARRLFTPGIDTAR